MAGAEGRAGVNDEAVHVEEVEVEVLHVDVEARGGHAHEQAEEGVANDDATTKDETANGVVAVVVVVAAADVDDADDAGVAGVKYAENVGGEEEDAEHKKDDGYANADEDVVQHEHGPDGAKA